MRCIAVFSLIIIAMISVSAQADIQKLIDTEHSFATFAAEHDTKSAFLGFMASDAMLFQPDKVNGPEYWNARGESKGLLSWAPNYADISTNGILGYTTGNWEYRAKGKDEAPGAFGDFVTVWLRQADGKYKFVIDIGVSHDKPEKYSNDWVTSLDKTKDSNSKNPPADDFIKGFYETTLNQSLKKAYETYAADDIRLYREEKLPFLGKSAAVKAVSSDKGIFQVAKRSTFFSSTDLAYLVSTYTRTVDGKVIEKGNYMQIWKLKSGKWSIVLDIFKPVPQK